MKPKALKRREAEIRQELRNQRTTKQQLIVLSSRPGESKKEVKRLSRA